MRKNFIYCLGAFLLPAQLFFSDILPCYAVQTGSDAVVRSAEEAPFITSVSISPGTTVVSKDSRCTFTAYVAGVNDYSREVVWSVSGQKSQSTFIDANGILNVGPDETASSMVVKAVSRQDSNYSAEALVSVRETTYYIQVKASPENGGAVYGSGAVKEGGSAVIEASANNGFTFEGWTLDGNRVSQESRYTVSNIRGDVTYIAEFKNITYRITVNVNDANAGTATESRDINHGDGMTLEAWAKEGYQFDGWTENGKTVSKDSRMPLENITESRTFTAVFSKKNEQPKTYTITASASSTNGTITPAGKTTVKEGEGILYTITPKDGYAVSAVYVDGNAVGWMNSFNFTDVREDHTISVDFKAVPAQDKNNAAAKPGQTGGKTGQNSDTTNKDNKTEKYNNTGNADKNKDEDRGQTDGEAVQESGLTGTLKELDVSVEEAKRLIQEKDDVELMNDALKTGDLRVTVHNDFRDAKKEAACQSIDGSADILNMEMMLASLLTGEEKIKLLQGDAPVAIDLYIENTNGKEAPQVQKSFAENRQPDMNIGQYFTVSLTVSKQEETQPVSALSPALKLVIPVPAHLKAENRKFYILRLHMKEDGSQGFAQLVDEDDNPDTITFSTDQFSSFAVAYIDQKPQGAEPAESAEDISGDGRLKKAAVAVIVVMAFAATMTGLLYIVGRRKR